MHGYADVSGGWYAMAALQNGGSAWQWVCDVLGLRWAELFDAAAATPAGAGGVASGRSSAGSGAASPDPSDRGGWSGLHPGTTRADLARAAVEGVAFAIGAAFRLLDAARRGRAGRAHRRRRRGRPSCSSCWPTCWAVRSGTCRLRSASAIGAAVLAGRGAGVDVVPEGPAGDVVEPRADDGLDAAAGPLGPDLTQAGAEPSAAGARTSARAASCRTPLVASALPPPGPGAPERSVNRPPASRTITSSAARSQSETSGSQAMSTAPSASRQ